MLPPHFKIEIPPPPPTDSKVFSYVLKNSLRTTPTNNPRPTEVTTTPGTQDTIAVLEQNFNVADIAFQMSYGGLTRSEAVNVLMMKQAWKHETDEIHVPDEWKRTFGRHYSGEDFIRSAGGVTRDDVEDILERKSRRSFFDSEPLRRSSTTPASSYFKDLTPSSSFYDESQPRPASSYFND